jgi:hypothetical protein
MAHISTFDITANPGNRRRGAGVRNVVPMLSAAGYLVKAISPT